MMKRNQVKIYLANSPVASPNSMRNDLRQRFIPARVTYGGVKTAHARLTACRLSRPTVAHGGILLSPALCD